MTLESAVKISQIATPFVLVCLGFLLNRSIQKHSQNLKLTSEFNTKWSDEFISKCRNFSESVTSIQLLIFNMSQDQKSSDDSSSRYSLPKKFQTDFNVLTKDIQQAKYKIEVHSALVDNSKNVAEIVDNIFEQCQKNILAVKNSGRVDFETIKLSQNKLHKELK